MASTQITTTVKSGDITLFVRRFGSPERTPLLILHGANYYDSADWVDVCEQLAADREVAAYDARGFGNSSWSESRDYGFASALGDTRAVLDHLGWGRVIVVGHSRGGAYALLAAARAPDVAAGLALVDYNPVPGFGPPGGAMPVADGSRPVFPTVEAALDSMTRYKPVPLTSGARARALEFLEAVEGGFRLAKRDPWFMSRAGETGTPLVPRDGLDELAEVRCPILIMHAKRSPNFKPEHIARLESIDRLELRAMDSGHDVVGEAPTAFVAALKAWLSRI